MNPAVRDQILTWLMLGDPIMLREAKAKLAPPRRPPPAPATTAEAIARVREDPSFPWLVASLLCQEFSDYKSYSGFLARAKEAWEGSLPVTVLQDAYRQAVGPKVKNRGAIFQVACRRRE
jgi:hypothetical protein